MNIELNSNEMRMILSSLNRGADRMNESEWKESKALSARLAALRDEHLAPPNPQRQAFTRHTIAQLVFEDSDVVFTVPVGVLDTPKTVADALFCAMRAGKMPIL